MFADKREIPNFKAKGLSAIKIELLVAHDLYILCILFFFFERIFLCFTRNHWVGYYYYRVKQRYDIVNSRA